MDSRFLVILGVVVVCCKSTLSNKVTQRDFTANQLYFYARACFLSENACLSIYYKKVRFSRPPQTVETFKVFEMCVWVLFFGVGGWLISVLVEHFWTVFAASKGQLLSKPDLLDPRGRQAVLPNISFLGQDSHSLTQYEQTTEKVPNTRKSLLDIIRFRKTTIKKSQVANCIMITLLTFHWNQYACSFWSHRHASKCQKNRTNIVILFVHLYWGNCMPS